MDKKEREVEMISNQKKSSPALMNDLVSKLATKRVNGTEGYPPSSKATTAPSNSSAKAPPQAGQSQIKDPSLLKLKEEILKQIHAEIQVAKSEIIEAIKSRK